MRMVNSLPSPWALTASEFRAQSRRLQNNRTTIKDSFWPREVAPADIHLIAAGKDEAIFAAANELAIELEAEGVRVLYDDRTTVSPGVKFNDSELIGIPTIVIVGKRLAEGFIEFKDRRTGERRDVALSEAVIEIKALSRN